MRIGDLLKERVRQGSRQSGVIENVLGRRSRSVRGDVDLVLELKCFREYQGRAGRLLSPTGKVFQLPHHAGSWKCGTPPTTGSERGELGPLFHTKELHTYKSIVRIYRIRPNTSALQIQTSLCPYAPSSPIFVFLDHPRTASMPESVNAFIREMK